MVEEFLKCLKYPSNQVNFSNLKHIKLLGIVSSAEGSVMVNYGETIVIAAIKSEVAEPDVDEPEKGFLSNAIFEINLMSYY